MKRCPKCNTEYFDNMLEFCLDDGTKLSFAAQPTGIRTQLDTAEMPSTIPQAASISHANSEETVVIRPRAAPAAEKAGAPPHLGEESQTAKIIATAPIVLALAHNWWQWIYLEKTYIYSITDFLLSANFLMWLLLLVSGTIVSLLAVKHSKDRTLGIISLVALAINLILFLVPRR